MEATHPEEAPGSLSGYYLAEEVSESRRVIELFVPGSEWARVARLGDAAFARLCLALALGADWSRYRSARRAPKKPPPRRASGKDPTATRHIA